MPNNRVLANTSCTNSASADCDKESVSTAKMGASNVLALNNDYEDIELQASDEAM